MAQHGGRTLWHRFPAGIADSQSVFHELYVALTLAALNTTRVRLGPVVTNPLTRHLVVTAGARQFITISFVPDPRAFMRRWAREVADTVG